jgi:DNA-binding transcriptional regulator YiaG
MKFTEQIKQLREERQMPQRQRQFAAALEIDTATYLQNRERRAARQSRTGCSDC